MIKTYIEMIRDKFAAKENREASNQQSEDKQIEDQRASLKFIQYGAIALAALAMCRGLLILAGADITVSNSVNGKELPIYCVETSEKKIALTFDAAWGNEDTAKILKILDKHKIKVTFFMTGGWVDK